MGYKGLLTAVACLFTAGCTTLCAQITRVNATKQSLRTGERVDIEVTLKGQWENPYRQEEAKLDIILVTPGGESVVLPAYYEQGKSGEQSSWKARFTPRMAGKYAFVASYSQPGLESVSKPQLLDVQQGSGHGFLHVNDQWTLRFDDGTLFRGIGENLCWESRASDDSKFFSNLHEQHERFSYPAMLTKFARLGGNFTRMWMCSWNFPIDRQKDFNNTRYTETAEPINESAAKRLDETLELCEKLGVEVMLCMGAGEQRTDKRFFASSEERARYHNRLRYIVARWGYSTSIAMWEFFNEIDNIQFRDQKNPIPAEDIVSWHAEMSRYLKSIDPYQHIITTSISHRDLKGLNDIPDMDINQKHIYKQTDVIPETIVQYEQRHGKPYIIGEFGYEWDWSKNFDDFAGGMDTDFRKGLWYGLFSPTPVTPMSWWWEYFDERKMNEYFTATALVNREMLEAGRGSFVPVKATMAGAMAYALKCGAKTFVYVFNPTKSTLKTIELEANGRAKELNIDKAQWGKPFTCKGQIKTQLKPQQERVFVIE